MDLPTIETHKQKLAREQRDRAVGQRKLFIGYVLPSKPPCSGFTILKLPGTPSEVREIDKEYFASHGYSPELHYQDPDHFLIICNGGHEKVVSSSNISRVHVCKECKAEEKASKILEEESSYAPELTEEEIQTLSKGREKEIAPFRGHMARLSREASVSATVDLPIRILEEILGCVHPKKQEYCRLLLKMYLERDPITSREDYITSQKHHQRKEHDYMNALCNDMIESLEAAQDDFKEALGAIACETKDNIQNALNERIDENARLDSLMQIIRVNGELSPEAKVAMVMSKFKNIIMVSKLADSSIKLRMGAKFAPPFITTKEEDEIWYKEVERVTRILEENEPEV